MAETDPVAAGLSIAPFDERRPVAAATGREAMTGRTDPAAAELDPVRERATLAADAEVSNLVRTYRAAESARDVPPLLAAVEAALANHERCPLYGNAATEGEPGNCTHDPDDERWHFESPDEPGEWLCQGRPEGAVCSTCTDGPGGERIDWPCDEYVSILAALTGQDRSAILTGLTGEAGNSLWRD